MYQFEKDGKTCYEARYWNPQGSNICIAASVTNYPDGRPFEWAAYVGANPLLNREEDAMKYALEFGDKLSIEDAHYYFPHLKEVPYRL